MTKNNRVHTEGADIVYDYEGQGPLLLLIAGGNGNGMRYARLAAQLASTKVSTIRNIARLPEHAIQLQRPGDAKRC